MHELRNDIRKFGETIGFKGEIYDSSTDLDSLVETSIERRPLIYKHECAEF